MRRLDILVPIYNEGQEVLKPLLDSLALQRNINFDELGVIVCCDGGSTVLTEDFMAQYPYHLEYHMLEHHGVSATRNAALELSEAEYISWSDCDDLYCDICGLWIVFREMDNETSYEDMVRFGLTKPERGFDMLISNFREETLGPDGQITYIDHSIPDSTFVHGKYMNRQWLIDNDLKFCPGYEIHEDSYEIIRCRELAKPWRLKWSPAAFYMWAWRSSSICRSDPKYILKTMPCLLASNEGVVDDFIRRGMEPTAAQYFVMIVFESFYTLNKPEWKDAASAEFRENLEHDFIGHFRRHRELWDKMDEHQKAMISQGVRQRTIQEGMLMETLTCSQWIDRLLQKFPEESAA